MADRTVTDVEADITMVRSAIEAVATVGQSYTINSGGSSRQVTLANLKELRTWLADLEQEKRNLEGYGGLVLGALS